MKKRLMWYTAVWTALMASYGQGSVQATQAQKTSAPAQAQKSAGKLWGVKVSPYVRVVNIILAEKKLPFEWDETFPAALLKATGKEVPEALIRISPWGKVPAYQPQGSQEGFHDSMVIGYYLDEAHPIPSLSPKCFKARARMMSYILDVRDKLAPLTHKILFEKVVKPVVLKQETDAAELSRAREALPEVLNHFEKALSEPGREWIAGSKHMSLADIHLVSHLLTLTTADEDLDDALTNHPNLLAYVQRVGTRNSFQSSLP